MKSNQPITTTQKLLAVVNIVLYCIMIVVNSLANMLPINGLTTGEISAKFPNLFVPAGFTFSIWGVIYLFLLISVVYQAILTFSIRKCTKMTLSYQLLFGVTLLLNFIWILVWHYLLIIPSVIVMVLLLRALIALYYKSKELSKLPYFAFKAPVELYFGWIVIATFANITALLVDRQWSGCPLSPSVWTVVVVVAGLLITIIKLEIYRAYIFALVVVWAYIGILAKLKSDVFEELVIIVVAALSILIILVFMAYTAIRNRRKVKIS